MPNIYPAPLNLVAKANPDGTSVMLTWENPDDCAYWSKTWIIKSRFGYVNSPIDTRGEILVTTTNETLVDSNITPGEVYYYTAFGVSAGLNTQYLISFAAAVAYLTNLGFKEMTTLINWATHKDDVNEEWGWDISGEDRALALDVNVFTALMYGE